MTTRNNNDVVSNTIRNVYHYSCVSRRWWAGWWWFRSWCWPFLFTRVTRPPSDGYSSSPYPAAFCSPHFPVSSPTFTGITTRRRKSGERCYTAAKDPNLPSATPCWPDAPEVRQPSYTFNILSQRNTLLSSSQYDSNLQKQIRRLDRSSSILQNIFKPIDEIVGPEF